MEIKVDSEWEEKHEIGEVVTVIGRYLDLDTNKIMIGCSWFGELILYELEEFKNKFRPVKESIPSMPSPCRQVCVDKEHYDRLLKTSENYHALLNLIEYNVMGE